MTCVLAIINIRSGRHFVSAHLGFFLTSAHATLIPVILSVLSVILSVSEESVASNRLFAPDPSLRLRLRSG